MSRVCGEGIYRRRKEGSGKIGPDGELMVGELTDYTKKGSKAKFSWLVTNVDLSQT